jgi:glycerophosphoryl diester phosphodiesterase
MRILGHRGQMSDGGPPENSVAAVHAALCAGADGVEVDVRLTADQVPVCVHDPDLMRIAGSRALVAATPWRVLRAIRLRGGHGIATLDEIVALVDSAATLVLDVKHEAGRPDASALAVASTLRRASAGRDVVVSSANEELLRAMAVVEPRLRRALITGPTRTVPAGWERVVAGGHHDLHPHLAAVLTDHTATEQVIAAGGVLRCWTVNRPVDARLLELIGVGEIISDVPRELRAVLTPRRPSRVAF